MAIDRTSYGAEPDDQGGNRQTFAARTPNLALGPLQKAPICAIEMRIADLGNITGVDTNIRAEVLDAKGEPIAGLYAVGTDANPITREPILPVG